MNTTEESPAYTASKDIVAGSFRGIAQVLVGHPLDTIKVRLQTQDPINPKYKGFIDCITKTWREEGIAGFFKGATSPISGCAFYSASLFLAYGQSKHFVATFFGNRDEYVQLILSGALTGTAASAVEGPIDLLKSKLQLSGTQYTGVFDCARQILAQKGFKSLYQGVQATILRNSIGSSVYFSSYEMIRSRMDNPNAHLSILAAGGLGVTPSIYPLDVIKTKLQTDHPLVAHRKYKGVLHCAREILRTEGLHGFWRGYQACIIRSFPVNAITFLVYENVRGMMG